MSKKKSFWWYVKEGSLFAFNTALVFLPDILALSPEYAIAGKVAGIVGQAWRLIGMRRHYIENTLPQAIDNLFNKLPDKVTGTKLPSGLSENNKG